jgi:hypothetical protein
MSTYCIEKATGTVADTQLAVGFARLLHQVYFVTGNEEEQILIRDKGPYWEIAGKTELTDEDLDQLQPFTLLRPLLTAKQRKALGAFAQAGFDYDEQVEQRQAYREQMASLPAKARSPEAYLRGDPALQELQERIAPPHPDLPLYATIQQMKVAPSFNEPVCRWLELTNNADIFRAHVRLLLEMFKQCPNPVEEQIVAWKTLAKTHDLGKENMTMLQVINPVTGKGANKPKADGLSIGGLKGFWLLELLKFVGFFGTALPQRIQNSDDRKTYVLRATALDLSTLDRLMGTFRKVVWPNTPAKLDVLAALRLAQVLVEHRRDVLAFLERQQKRRRQKPISFTELVQGLDMTFYKSLGTSSATMNISFVGMPDWLPFPQDEEAASQVDNLLEEHIRVVNLLDESKGGEEQLLQRYRDFLSSRDPELTAFFTFMRGYSSLLMGRLAKNQWVVYISTNNLEVLMNARDQQNPEKKPLAAILSHPGFQSVASAIRESTIRAQYRTAQQNDKRYAVSYGLGHDLARGLHNRETFISVLMDFIHRYNAETAREEEKAAKEVGGELSKEIRRAKKLRRMVSTAELDDLMQVIDEYGYRVVANMLIAYGYAFDSRVPAKAQETEQEAEQEAEQV